MTEQITTKPFVSQAQAGWAFATGQPFARRWARQTGPYKKLPKRVKRKAATPCTECILASLKGEQIAPGVTRIRGNLCNVHGRYGRCPGAGATRVAPKKLPAGAKPKGGGKGRKPRAARKPTKTEAQRQQERDAKQQQRAAEREAARQAVYDKMGIAPDGRAALEALRRGEQPDAAAIERGGFVKAGLVEQAADGSYRMTASGRALTSAADAGDAGRAGDTISAARDRTTARTTRQEAAAQRKRDAEAKRQAAAAKKPKAGGSAPKPKQPALRQPRAVRASQPAVAQTGGGGAQPKPATPEIPQQLRDAVQALSDGQALDQQTIDQLVRSGLARMVKGQPVLTAMGLRALSRSKSFAVFKDATGAMRWLSRTTTAFEDRDQEVISTKALAESAASDAPRGPLRFWHMGRPNPLDGERPWGPGVDLGWCDFAALSGRTLIESGTFKSEAIARAVAAKADQLEMSPGFFHAAGEPDASGVFDHIRIFERSLVPKWAGRASNPYTGFVVEKTMDQKKIDALKTLGVDEATIKELLGEVAQAEKSADDSGARYKDEKPEPTFIERLKAFLGAEQAREDAAPAAEVAPVEPPADPLAALKSQLDTVQAELAALKAAPPPMDAEPETQADVPMEEAPAMEEDAGGLTLSAEDLTAIGQLVGAAITAGMEPLVGALGIVQKLEGGLGELKTAMSGYAKTKDDAETQRAGEIAALKATIDQQQARLAELIDDQPRGGYRPSQATDNTLAQALLAATRKESTVNGRPEPTADDPFADLAYELLPGARPH